jgi:hypothetical protein
MHFPTNIFMLIMRKNDTSTFGERLAAFYEGLRLEALLPSGIEAMNPYTQAHTQDCVRKFCTEFYNDNTPRVSVWGINPGRFGGGVTGLSFTDPVILREVCGIETHVSSPRELSAEYVWRVIAEYGGAGKQGAVRFFSRFFLTALCPLGFIRRTEKSVVNYNFYDDKALFATVKPFIQATMQEQCDLGIRRDVAVCFGTGKLHAAFEAINAEHCFFDRIIPLEHPRFIMQYRRKQLQEYLDKYVETLHSVES